jgi:hypothetical protein
MNDPYLLMRRAGLALAVLAACVVAGCGSGGGSASGNSLQRAAAQTIDQGTSRFVVTAAGETVRGAADLRTRIFEFVSTDGGETDRVLMADGKWYFRLPEGDRQWVELERDAGLADAAGFLVTRFFDPSTFLESLRTAADVEDLGAETVDGVATRHYRAQVSFADLVALAPPEQRAWFERSLDDDDRDRIPFDVWVDEDGLTRRIRAIDTTGAKDETFTVDFFDFGADVDLERPSGEEVVVLGQLWEELRREFERSLADGS